MVCICGDLYLKTKQAQEQQQHSNRAQAIAGEPEPFI
jgi:hypothetical protein